MASGGATDRPAAPQQPAAPQEEEEEAGDIEESRATAAICASQRSMDSQETEQNTHCRSSSVWSTEIEESRATTAIGASQSSMDSQETEQNTHGRSSSLLSTEIEESLVHGVPLVTLFQGFGEAFRDHTFVVGDYEKSQEVCQLHEFISHDWFSGRMGKFFALCLLYNSWPAIAVSSTLGLVVGLLEVFEVLPFPVPNHDKPRIFHCFGCWAQLLCSPVFFGVLVWWQHVPRWPRRGSRMVFFDKCCIDQGDSRRKRAGILGLGGFLKRSDRLVILWTPRYFTRLWCTFEVASWLHLQKSFDSVLFLPLSHAAVTVLCTFAAAILMLAYSCSFFLFNASWNGMALTGIIVLGFPFPAHYMRYSVHEIGRFPERLEQFSITKADCFCCSNNHRAPNDSSVEIPCDRELVELTVRAWFSRHTLALEANSSLASLESFDHEFRGLFGKFASKHAGLAHLPYKYALLYLFPVMFRGFDAMSAFAHIPGHHHVQYCKATRKIVEFLVTVFCAGPSIVGLVLRFLAVVDRVVGLPQNRCLDLLASLVTAQLGAMIFLLLWIPLNVANNVDCPWPFVACSLMEVVLTLVLYRKDLLTMCFGEPAAPHSWSNGQLSARSWTRCRRCGH